MPVSPWHTIARQVGPLPDTPSAFSANDVLAQRMSHWYRCGISEPGTSDDGEAAERAWALSSGPAVG